MLFIFGAIFSIIDLKSHRVPNRLLIIYAFVGVYENRHLSYLQVQGSVIVVCVFLLFHVLLKLGAGDVKYAVISSLYISTNSFDRFFLSLWISSLVILIGTIAYRMISGSSWRGPIAYIPAIFGALLIN